MNVREEDRQKSNCPSRGLGIAAAAIGVGVGAALYYFFSKRTENPHGEGSTSDWSCERPDTFFSTPLIDNSDDSYTTMSEHETSDTSINQSTEPDNETTESDSETTESDNDYVSDSDEESDGSSNSELFETGYTSNTSDMYDVVSQTSESDSDVTAEWDVTSSSSGVPEVDMSSSYHTIFSALASCISPRRRVRMSEEEQLTLLRQQAFRERSWTLEECSICFEVMLRSQELMALPCTHNFHTQCILPWLQEKQTCPNCRKLAE